MQVIRSDEGETTERTGQAIFRGQVWGRNLTSSEEGAQLNSTVVHFAVGARTNLHTHSGDQFLYVISGMGKVGTTEDEHVVTTGDTILIPAGEPHWHGAADTGSPMAHLTVQHASSQTEVLE
jgi:quercetin dioxygenase-like cupin family protein